MLEIKYSEGWYVGRNYMYLKNGFEPDDEFSYMGILW